MLSSDVIWFDYLFVNLHYIVERNGAGIYAIAIPCQIYLLMIQLFMCYFDMINRPVFKVDLNYFSLPKIKFSATSLLKTKKKQRIKPIILFLLRKPMIYIFFFFFGKTL